MYRLLLWMACLVVLCRAQDYQGQWQNLDEGLEFAEFKSMLFPSTGDSVVTVLRIDPAEYRFRYLVASEFDSSSLLLKAWVDKFGLAAAINAGMYAKDYLTHVGYSKHAGKVHSARVLKNYKSVLAFDPVDKSLPEVQLIDMECQNFGDLKSRYGTLIQNIRMINCRGNNVWSKQQERWSTAALGQDSSGHLLFLFAQSPYSVYEFIQIIKRLPLSLARAMYLEGGSPAGMYIKAGSKEVNLHGLVNDTDDKEAGFPLELPNVIGIVKKDR
jgi:uncharacterized protein YigE (DUF2233 family)